MPHIRSIALLAAITLIGCASYHGEQTDIRVMGSPKNSPPAPAPSNPALVNDGVPITGTGLPLTAAGR